MKDWSKQKRINLDKYNDDKFIKKLTKDFKIKVPLIDKHIKNNDGKVVISPFEIKNNYNNFANINYTNDTNLKYIIIDVYEIASIFERLSKPAIRVLFNIFYNLDKDSNIVRFNINDLANNKSYNIATEYYYYKELIDNKLIAKTDKRCIYIINHNIFYKGDLNKFRETYLKYYSNINVEYNKNNEVIISNL